MHIISACLSILAVAALWVWSVRRQDESRVEIARLHERCAEAERRQAHRAGRRAGHVRRLRLMETIVIRRSGWNPLTAQRRVHNALIDIAMPLPRRDERPH